MHTGVSCSCKVNILYSFKYCGATFFISGSNRKFHKTPDAQFHQNQDQHSVVSRGDGTAADGRATTRYLARTTHARFMCYAGQ